MPIPSGYQPLIDYLREWRGDCVTLTIARIEEILDAALPPSASHKVAWWTKRYDTPVRLWRAAGWHARYYPGAGVVHFTRDPDAIAPGCKHPRIAHTQSGEDARIDAAHSRYSG